MMSDLTLAFCIFRHFFRRISAAEDDLDAMIRVHLDAFRPLPEAVSVTVFYEMQITYVRREKHPKRREGKVVV